MMVGGGGQLWKALVSSLLYCNINSLVFSKRACTYCFGTTDGHLTMDGRQAIDARIEQFRNV
jgi:hypothetical protein